MRHLRLPISDDHWIILMACVALAMAVFLAAVAVWKLWLWLDL